MSINIQNLILHKLSKNEQEELTVSYRAESLQADDKSESLVSELHRVFNAKNAKGFGFFQDDSDLNIWLDEMRSDERSFYDFSQVSAGRLKDELSKYPFADEGTLVIAQYQSLATDYLFIALIKSNHRIKITGGLDIGATDYLDIEKMDIAARIDLTSYDTDRESNRYISYIKGRVGRKIADFFLDFMQAEVGLNTKVQNQVLMQAVSDFCSDSRFDKEESNSFKKQVADYCGDQIKHGDEVNVKELSGELAAGFDGSTFQDYVSKQGYELADNFPGDRASIRKLTKFVGAGGGLNINFDSLLLGERIFYDPETDTLTIKGTPPNLRDQLTRQ